MVKLTYTKPPLSIDEQVQLLVDRGMLVRDNDIATLFLMRINYYRFCGYALHFEILDEAGNRTDAFESGTTFEDVVRLCKFDTELRHLLLRFIDTLEVAFRTALCYEMATRTGESHWHTNSQYFSNLTTHSDFIAECKKEMQRVRSEVFIKAYLEKYYSPKLIPSWMMVAWIQLASATNGLMPYST